VTPESGLQFDPRTVRKVPDNYFGATVKNWVHAGDAGELSTVALSFGNYKQFWDSILGQTLGFNHPALDPNTAGSLGVLTVLAEFAGRPDMSPAELENRLRNTNYWKSLTDSQREWNSLAPAEQQKRRAEMLTQMQDVWQQFGGVRPDGSDPRIANHLENLASGKTTFNTYVANVKTLAEALPDSPWSRQQREEAERNRQRPIDIENTAQRIRETTERWGVQWSAGTVNQWAKEMVEKFKSDEDLILELRKQAQVLYPWKSPEVETMTAAAPWMETYRRVMERNASLFDAPIQQALTAGQGVWDFEQNLKKSDEWLSTRNGQDTMHSAINEVGRRMGFVN
jgi:hypothetical protein